MVPEVITGTYGGVAVVTGGGRGIGQAIALRMAAGGHAVAVLDMDEEGAQATVEQILARGSRAAAFVADVSDESAVNSAIESVRSKLGSPTILINNAGVTRDNLLFRMTTTEWDDVISVHLRGAFLMSRACQRFMVEETFGRIVNISSTSALGNRGQANYSAAKAGLLGLTKTLAIELGPFGITVNAIAPGFIETKMTEATARRLGIDFEEHKRQRAASIPVRRTGTPDDIAHSVSFLVSPEAGYVNGQVLFVAGGPKG